MKKNKIILFLGLIGSLLTINACKKGQALDQVKTTDLTEESTFADSARTMQFVTRIYNDIGFSADPKRFAALAVNPSSVGVYALGDEVEYSTQSGSAWNVIFQTGSVSSLQIPDDAWVTTYANIRRVNVFLSHVATTPLSAALRSRLTGEARFLRAWYYFILLKHYGGIPLVGDAIYTSEDNIPGKRATFDACVNYISSECDAAAGLLPLQQLGLDYGRITKGACLALKSRLLLYAASPLFNARPDADYLDKLGTLKGILSYPSYDATRWNKAAQAALDVINLGQYSLVDLPAPAGNPVGYTAGYGFDRVFVTRKNSEYILAVMAGNNRTLEAIWDPPSRGGSGSAWPYQDLVDAFGTINGKPITTDIKSASNPQGYDAANPYLNRDPRFNWSIYYNGAYRLNTSKTVTQGFTYTGYSQDGEPTTRTGYYVRKMLDDNTIASATSSTTERCFPLIRYAEILLNYAEASNEAGDINTAYTQLKTVRARAGILPGAGNNYGLATGLSKEDMRTVIQNERRVELSFEEHRYWDVRRWRIAENIANQPLHGVTILQAGATFTYTPNIIRTPVFTTPKWYLWPIPQGEVNKSTDLVQNPGW
ncbi:RagB/SusD family nutrient uptake outer membrane protein [Mucilaginibacter sp. AW1-3]